MKKIFYFLFALSVISCSSDDDIVSENQQATADLKPEKAYAFYTDFPKAPMLSPLNYYTFSYENEKLVKMTGKVQEFSNVGYLFLSEPYRTLSYNDNKVELKYSDDPYTTVIYTMESDRPKKSELYIYDELVTSKSYTYESNKVMIYEDSYNKNREAFTTYFFDSNKNLIKSEKLEKSGGMDIKFTSTIYSDFDNAKNPFKKLVLINDNFYEKSLSANNFRKREAVIQYLPNAANGNIQLPPGFDNSQWTYQYDSNGQVLLYHPL